MAGFSYCTHRVRLFFEEMGGGLRDPYYRLHQSPTQSLYWLNRWIQSGVPASDIARAGRNAYWKKGDGIYFSRTLSAPAFQALSARGASMHYLIDDDYDALASDASLPTGYRRKIERFSREVFPQICRCIEVNLYAASDVLSERFSCPKLDPIWLPEAGDGNPGRSIGTEVRLAFLSTASHLKDFSELVDSWLPEINRTLREAGRTASLTHYLKSHLEIRQLPEFSNLRWEHRYALSWNVYRREIPREGFDAVLYPLRPTPVNEARSNSKLVEGGMMGIPVFKECSPLLAWMNGLSQ